MKRIYMDYAATTPVDPRVLKAMQPFFSDMYGNASSIHKFGRDAKNALEESRSTIADLLNAKDGQIIFTSGGTESDNLAIKGTVFSKKDEGKHIITSKIEHDAVLNTFKWLEGQGFEVTYLPVDKYGLIDPSELENSIRKDTILTSIMFANNEIGTVEPVQEIGRICRKHNIVFHTDAVQAFGKIPIDVNKMNIDLMTMSAHKIYGPKGVGGLFIRNGLNIEPIAHGGGHEFDLRPGTENVSGIVGFAAAAELVSKEMGKENKRLVDLRDRLIKGVIGIENSRLNGHPTKRLPNNTNFSFKFIEGESLVALLDAKGIAASTGSACSSKSLEPSHVLLAIGLKHEDAHGSLRLSLGKYNGKSDVDYVLEVLPEIVSKLREISPFR